MNFEVKWRGRRRDEALNDTRVRVRRSQGACGAGRQHIDYEDCNYTVMYFL